MCECLRVTLLVSLSSSSWSLKHCEFYLVAMVTGAIRRAEWGRCEDASLPDFYKCITTVHLHHTHTCARTHTHTEDTSAYVASFFLYFLHCKLYSPSSMVWIRMMKHCVWLVGDTMCLCDIYYYNKPVGHSVNRNNSQYLGASSVEGRYLSQHFLIRPAEFMNAGTLTKLCKFCSLPACNQTPLKDDWSLEVQLQTHLGYILCMYCYRE